MHFSCSKIDAILLILSFRCIDVFSLRHLPCVSILLKDKIETLGFYPVCHKLNGTSNMFISGAAENEFLAVSRIKNIRSLWRPYCYKLTGTVLLFAWKLNASYIFTAIIMADLVASSIVMVVINRKLTTDLSKVLQHLNLKRAIAINFVFWGHKSSHCGLLIQIS